MERRHWALGDPDIGAERLQVLSIGAHGKLTPQFQNAPYAAAGSLYGILPTYKM